MLLPRCGVQLGCIAAVTILINLTPAVAANCMDTDRTYWEGGNRLPSYDVLMELMACQANASPVEGQQLNDTSACNWFLSRALERLYGVKDFIPESDDEWLNANAIADYVKGHPDVWSKLGDGKDQQVLIEAAAGAANGQPVIAVTKGNPHGHVAMILPGPLTSSGAWGLNVPNSASFFLSSNRVVDKAYVGCKLSYAFASKEGVEIYWRVKAQ